MCNFMSKCVFAEDLTTIIAYFTYCLWGHSLKERWHYLLFVVTQSKREVEDLKCLFVFYQSGRKGSFPPFFCGGKEGMNDRDACC